MWTNYLKLAWRNLIRNRNYSLVNIAGLAIGLACVMLISLYVRDELSYDRFHPDGDRIYRLALERIYPGRSRSYAMIPPSYAQVLKSDIPGVEESTRLFYFQDFTMLYKVNDIPYEESHILWADSNVFAIFDLPLIQGQPEDALTKPQSVILSENTAKKLFANTNVLGQTLDIPQSEDDLTVTGVFQDLPENSHMKFNMLSSSTSLPFLAQPNYLGFAAYTYLKLTPGTSPSSVEKAMPDMVTKYASGQVLNQFGVNYEEYQKQGNGYRYFLQPLPGIYLDSNLESEIRLPGSRQRVYFFIAIALLILIIACINFMNLATARSAGRAREVGIRKTLGSERTQIITQFMLEAVIISLVAAAFALVINWTILPYFNTLTNKTFLLEDLRDPVYLGILVTLAVFAGFLAGSYPSFALSRFKPVEVFQGKWMQRTTGAGLRNSLVVFQFAISVFLIISSLLVYRQWIYTQNKDLGFDKESLLTLEGAGGMNAQESETFKKELANLAGVIAVSGCNTQPGGQYFGMSFKPQVAQEMTTGSGLIVDEGYIECMKMDLIKGRSFSKEFMDTLSIVVNEAAVREMGIQGDPIGTRLISNDDFLNSNEGTNDVYTIVGVIRDFHFQSLHHAISPLFLIHNQKGFSPGVDNLVTLRMSNSDLTTTLVQMENLWKQFQPDVPFRYSFMDQDWANLYDKEITTRRIFLIFTILAIFIACLGLLALASYTAERRTKELGVRKILGASPAHIVGLLSKDFLKLVLIAIIVATPLAWYAMTSWLEGFAYRITLGPGIFVLAAGIALFIAFITVSIQGVKSAIGNPLKALRTE